uniref:hypothetical protein n=1 Tax=Frigoriglobus tundricola TaxID=2774151 RepID=UPI0036F350B5
MTHTYDPAGRVTGVATAGPAGLVRRSPTHSTPWAAGPPSPPPTGPAPPTPTTTPGN